MTKAFPFTDSMKSLDLAPDPQHLINSPKVAWRNASSLKCLFMFLNMASLYLNPFHCRREKISGHVALTVTLVDNTPGLLNIPEQYSLV